MLVLIISFVFVFYFHWAASRFTQIDNPSTAFKLSRAVAGTVLGLIGLSSAVIYPELWAGGFLGEHSRSSWPSVVVLMGIGFFLAELYWVIFLRVFQAVPARAELVFHHILGIGALGCSYYCGVGQATCSVGLVTEVLAFSGGWISLGQLKDRPSWTKKGETARLATLKYLRLPVWTYFLISLQLPWFSGGASIHDLTATSSVRAFAICRLVALLTSLGLIFHDLYCLHLLRGRDVKHIEGRTEQAPSLG